MEIHTILQFDYSSGDDTVQISIMSSDSALNKSTSVQFVTNESQHLLAQVNTLAEQTAVRLSDISAVLVVHGEARFTVSRLVAVVANGIGWSNRIPVLSVDTPVTPEQIDGLQIANLACTLMTPVYSNIT